LLLAVRLDGSLLADALSAYEVGNELLLPLGELARLLTLGVTLDPATRSAAGFVVREDRGFRLELDAARVSLPGAAPEAVDPALMRWLDDDLYVASRLLQRWWPLDLDLQLSSLTRTVVPREKLPIQARLERERAARALSARHRLRRPGLSPRPGRLPALKPAVHRPDAGPANEPQRRRQHQPQRRLERLPDGRPAGHGSGPSTRERPQPDLRLTLSRHDPAGGLLGPLRARCSRWATWACRCWPT